MGENPQIYTVFCRAYMLFYASSAVLKTEPAFYTWPALFLYSMNIMYAESVL